MTEASGGTTVFRYDGGTSFHELDDNGDIAVEFVRGGSGAGMGGGIGSILYSDRSAASGPVEFYTYNAVGHTVALTDDSGDVMKSDLYEAFGNVVTSTGTSDNNRLANTKERDASIGLDNHGYRYYDPSTGRYLTRDPIGYADGMNVYLSVHNNPINHSDPQGLQSIGDDFARTAGYPNYAAAQASLYAGYQRAQTPQGQAELMQQNAGVNSHFDLTHLRSSGIDPPGSGC